MPTKIAQILDKYDISPEKIDLISQYIDNVVKFNKGVQLSRIGEMNTWMISHIEDSCAAYFNHPFKKLERYYDFGSGNGLPAVIFAILSEKPVTSYDKDQRKLEFQKFVSHRLKLSLDTRIVDLKTFNMDVPRGTAITYRGLGPGSLLIDLRDRFSSATHIRFCSKLQDPIWSSSKLIKYNLSDSSERILEITT